MSKKWGQTTECGDFRLNLVEKYDGRCSFEYIRNYIEYLEMTIEEFWDVVRRFINTDIWIPNGKDSWILKHPHYERDFKIYYEW